ncbi:posterior protein-like [Engystomops pustulosus]|uniref:posterior protein-like n=1 Tax=Engystomops pustulosus TaxID=76066 RepID=UPI003AFB7A42
MELVQNFVKKYASARYQLCADGSLEEQYKELMMQCKAHNKKLDRKVLSKRGKKERLGNEIMMLIKMKELAEVKEVNWYIQRLQCKESIDRISDTVIEISAKTTSEMDNLQAKVDELTLRNEDLDKQLHECRLSSVSTETHTQSLEREIHQRDMIITSLKGQLSETMAQLCKQEEQIRSFQLQNQTCHKAADVCIVTPGSDEHNLIPAEKSPTLTIQDRLHLCQVIGEWDTNESPIIVSNKFEAVVKQYNLCNKDAWSLLQAWLPGPLATQLSSAHMGDEDCGADLRRKELQRIMGGRDVRGENTLRRYRFRTGDDPLIFCNKSLTLFRSVYNCHDMSQDDSDFLYLMANQCNVDYTTKIGLRNAKSLENFINILRDWCEESNYRDEPSGNLSPEYRARRTRYVRYCYGCGRPGHIKRFCDVNNANHETHYNSLHAEIDVIEPETIEEAMTSFGSSHTEAYEVTLAPPENSHTETCEENTSHANKIPNIHRDKKEQPPSHCRQHKEGANVPVYNPWAGLPFWLFWSWSQIALPLLINSAQYSSSVAY